MAGSTALIHQGPEWLCREDNVLWGADTRGNNPGCWMCGAPGDERPTEGARPGLPEWAGYGFAQSAGWGLRWMRGG